MLIKEISYGSKNYQQTIKLRDKVMKVPLNRSIYDEELFKEKEAYILGAFANEQLLGTAVLSQIEREDLLKLDYLCVDTDIQNKHVGTKLLQTIEEYTLSIGKNSIVLEARMTAVPFYKKQNYIPFGETFTKVNAPVEHILMNKQLIGEAGNPF